MKYFFLIPSAVLVVVNLALLWQMYHKIKRPPVGDEATDLKPYLMGRLTAFSINFAIIAMLMIVYRVCNLFGLIP